MPEKHSVAPSLVAVVNVGRTWPEAKHDARKRANAVLGDWNPFRGSSSTKLAFDPAAVALILAYCGGT